MALLLTARTGSSPSHRRGRKHLRRHRLSLLQNSSSTGSSSLQLVECERVNAVVPVRLCSGCLH